ncbi:MAG: SiaB family protein kinase [Perlabentimonas sp.]
MAKRENILAHYGPLSYEEIGFLLNRMTAFVDKQGMGITIKKKVYSAMVESLENIYKHQDIISSNTGFQPRFSLFVDEKEFSLLASNSLLNSKIPPLKEKLDKVNSLDKEGLKDLYKLTILSGNVSPKGGAGLGIINIAKVSENHINYNFETIDEDYSYFTINVVISRNA